MKTVLMILVLVGGLVTSNALAQSCKPANCAPCPPGCCIINCCPGKGSAASASNAVSTELMFATMVSEGQNANCQPAQMSRKERKACMAACKANPSCTTTGAAAAVNVPACTGQQVKDSETHFHQASAKSGSKI